MRHSRSYTRLFFFHLHFHSFLFFFFSSTKLKKFVDTFCRSSYFFTSLILSTYFLFSSISSITSFLFCHDFSFFSSIRSHRSYSVMILLLFIRQYEHIAFIHSLFIKNTNHWQAERKSKHWKRSNIDQTSRNRWMRISRMILKWRLMRTQRIQSESYASR